MKGTTKEKTFAADLATVLRAISLLDVYTAAGRKTEDGERTRRSRPEASNSGRSIHPRDGTDAGR